MKKPVSYLLLLAALFQSGCSTIGVNAGLRASFKAPVGLSAKNGCAGGPPYTYGGTIFNLEKAFYLVSGGPFREDEPIEAAVAIYVPLFFYLVIDSPFSFLADTLYLPVSIPRDVSYFKDCGTLREIEKPKVNDGAAKSS